MLKQSGSVDGVLDDGETLLHLTAFHHEDGVIRLVIDREALVGMCDCDVPTALISSRVTRVMI